MNFSSYDPLEVVINYWIWIPHKMLYLTGIKHRKHYCFLCRYDPKNTDYDYFICLSDDEINIPNVKVHNTSRNNKGVLRLDISGIIDNLPIKQDCVNKAVDIELVEEGENTEIYKLNLFS